MDPPLGTQATGVDQPALDRNPWEHYFGPGVSVAGRVVGVVTGGWGSGGERTLVLLVFFFFKALLRGPFREFFLSQGTGPKFFVVSRIHWHPWQKNRYVHKQKQQQTAGVSWRLLWGRLLLVVPLVAWWPLSTQALGWAGPGLLVFLWDWRSAGAPYLRCPPKLWRLAWCRFSLLKPLQVKAKEQRIWSAKLRHETDTAIEPLRCWFVRISFIFLSETRCSWFE